MTSSWIVIWAISVIAVGAAMAWIGHYAGYNSGRRDEEKEHEKEER